MNRESIDRREWLKVAGLLGLGVGFGGVGCSTSPPSPTTTTLPPPPTIGPLEPVNANGLRIPPGFTSRVVATAGRQVGSTGYVYPANPDGAAVFPKQGGGWILTINHETAAPNGGVSRIVFSSTGAVVDAGRILGGTNRNCAGGASAWGTWLSCEEASGGLVWECDPMNVTPSVARPAMGAFSHEAVAYYPNGDVLFLTEDQPDGCLYRFTPTTYGDLSAGTLDVLCESAGALSWQSITNPSGSPTATRYQRPTAKVFAGGEGICHFNGAMYFTTKHDNHVWKYDPVANTVTIIYQAPATGAILRGVDNITSNRSGDLFVAEDGDDMQVVLVRNGVPQPVVQVIGVTGSEITGPAFSPDGTRLYFSSQRNPGTTYEVSGPWN